MDNPWKSSTVNRLYKHIPKSTTSNAYSDINLLSIFFTCEIKGPCNVLMLTMILFLDRRFS